MRDIQNIQTVKDEPICVPPFLKWAGGKRWLAPTINARIGTLKGRYIEPFLGGGAVFFQLQPNSAILNDSNADLINAYVAIKSDYKQVVTLLAQHHRRHSYEYYYKMRDYRPRCEFRRAARFIYLNRTCWNGLYRVNLNGIFNVPIGTKSTVLLSGDNWEGVAESLKGALLCSEDFEKIIDQAESGDLIFADPPYTVKHNLNGFIKYNESLFSWADQVRLSIALKRAEKRGVDVILTNANHVSVRSLYKDSFRLHTLERSNVLSGDPKFRGKFQELLIVSESIWD